MSTSSRADGPKRSEESKNTAGQRTSTSGKQGSTARKVAVGAVFTALALVFSWIEFLLPGVGIPGVKLGLANLIIVIVVYRLGYRYAWIVNIARIVLAGLMFTGLFSMLYSLAGGVVSLTVMCLLHRTGMFSVIGVSMGAAVAHNFGQILVASFVIEDIRMFSYFPVLVLSGIVSGILIGIIAFLIMKRLPGADAGNS